MEQKPRRDRATLNTLCKLNIAVQTVQVTGMQTNSEWTRLQALSTSQLIPFPEGSHKPLSKAVSDIPQVL